MREDFISTTRQGAFRVMSEALATIEAAAGVFSSFDRELVALTSKAMDKLKTMETFESPRIKAEVRRYAALLRTALNGADHANAMRHALDDMQESLHAFVAREYGLASKKAAKVDSRFVN